MRALILLESLVVIALAAAYLFAGTAVAPEQGDAFPAQFFLFDANPGETIRYYIDNGRRTLQYTVGGVDKGGSTGPPRLQISRLLTDGEGRAVADEAPEYTHLPHRHGLFPFLSPEAPAAYDRVWILKRIRREDHAWHGMTMRCWHVECIDPGLPAANSAVECWMREDVPVFGIFEWTHNGHTYDSDWRPK